MIHLVSIRFVLLKRFEELTGYTEKAVRAKMARGDWLQGREYVKAPDGHIMVDLEGYERWVLGEAASDPRPTRALRSTSTIGTSAAANA